MLVASIVGVIAFAVASQFTIRKGYAEWHYAQLYRYQSAKLNTITNGGILLLGDSTLGNVITAKDWSNLLKVPVTSLALTGIYGYAGSLNMLRRTLRRARPETVVIVHSSDMFARKVSHKGLVLTSENLEDLAEAPLSALFSALVNLDFSWQAIKSVYFGRLPPTSKLAEVDYIPQAPSFPETKPMPVKSQPLLLSNINDEKTYYLTALARLCKTADIRCFYMHGPIFNQLCRGSKAYFSEVNRRIEAVGLRVVSGTPACMPWSDIGDSIDHVNPVHKRRYGLYYLELLQKVSPVGR